MRKRKVEPGRVFKITDEDVLRVVIGQTPRTGLTIGEIAAYFGCKPGESMYNRISSRVRKLWGYQKLARRKRGGNKDFWFPGVEFPKDLKPHDQ